MSTNRHHHEFPKPIARLSGLEGGQYGEIYLKALTRHRMELDLGNEFVTFNRAQATAFKDAICAFLELEEKYEAKREEHREEKIIGEIVEGAVEGIAEEIEARPPARRRKRP